MNPMVPVKARLHDSRMAARLHQVFATKEHRERKKEGFSTAGCGDGA